MKRPFIQVVVKMNCNRFGTRLAVCAGITFVVDVSWFDVNVHAFVIHDQHEGQHKGSSLVATGAAVALGY